MPSTSHELTSREREILVLMAHARTNKQIASTLVISLNTVKTRVKSILEKLVVSTRGEASEWYWEHESSPQMDDARIGR